MKLLLATLLTFATPAVAGDITSVYSNFDFKNCKQITADVESESATWACKGIKGWPVTYYEGDLRGSVSFGEKPATQCSAAQTFSAFNSPGPRIEWRMQNGKPFATILRWTTDNGESGKKHSWLVVTKLDGAKTCRTAIVDGAMPEANKIAHEKADASINFDCEKSEPEIVSTRELKADELMSGAPCGPGPYN